MYLQNTVPLAYIIRMARDNGTVPLDSGEICLM